ncbi:MAG: class I SAM-dependent methyltransferase [Gemmatimonadaceae bacterium]
MSPFDANAYWENRLRASYDERGVGDIGMSRAYNSYLYSIRRRVFRRCVSRLPVNPSTSRVLDIGSGTGVYVDEWRRWGAAKVTGVDITPTAVERLRVAFPQFKFIQSDIGEASQPTEISSGYDVVSAFDVLFHIVDDVQYHQALQNIFNALSPRGWFLYSENLVPHESRLTHYVSRSEKTIMDSLRQNGFEVISRAPVFVLMNDPVRTRMRVMRRWYSLLHRVAGAGEVIGGLLGAALYPIELAATRIVKHGPGTEILVCRRTS